MKVSIGIPFYNPGSFFKESIVSILKQTYTDFELILLDDGSSDGSLEIALSFNDPRIKVISDGTNKGLPCRLNELIELSQGDYIARMDADDLISATKIEQQVHYLDTNSHVDLVSTGMCSISNNNIVKGYRNPAIKPVVGISFEQAVFGKADIAHATVMARKNWFERNQYNEQAKLMEDYQLWIDSSLKNDLNIGFIHTPLYFYREESSISSKKTIIAYKNQFNLVASKYFNKLSFYQKIKFSLQMLIKSFVVFILNLFKNSNVILALRNKNTQQDQVVISTLQKELDAIGKINE